MATGIRQVVFENGENMKTVSKNLNAVGLNLVTVVDMYGKEAYPVDRTHERDNGEEPVNLGPGGFTMEAVQLDFDMVIIMYLHPVSPEIDCVYYAKTEAI